MRVPTRFSSPAQKRLKVRRNIASKAARRWAGFSWAIWEGAVHKTHCGVGQRLKAGSEERCPAGRPPARRLPSLALRASPPPRPRAARALAPAAPAAAAPPHSRPARPGGGGPVAPPYLAPAARSAKELGARGRDSGAALGSSCGEGGAPISPSERGSAPRSQCVLSPSAVAPQLPPPLASEATPLRTRGTNPPHLASARHYCPISCRKRQLPSPGP